MAAVPIFSVFVLKENSGLTHDGVDMIVYFLAGIHPLGRFVKLMHDRIIDALYLVFCEKFDTTVDNFHITVGKPHRKCELGCVSDQFLLSIHVHALEL